MQEESLIRSQKNICTFCQTPIKNDDETFIVLHVLRHIIKTAGWRIKDALFTDAGKN